MRTRPSHVDGRKTGWQKQHDDVYAGFRSEGLGRRNRRSMRWTPRVSTSPCSSRLVACSSSASTRSSRSVADGLEPEFATAIARAYNDWLKDFCDHSPDRMFGAGMVAPHDVGGAVERSATVRGGARFQGDLPAARPQ